jgi:hypothetical protein
VLQIRRIILCITRSIVLAISVIAYIFNPVVRGINWIRAVLVSTRMLYVPSARRGAYYEGVLWYLRVEISVMILAILTGYIIMVIDRFKY